MAETRRSAWLDGKPQVATEADLQARWSFGKPGENFRCYLCGHKFRVGDIWRFVYSGGVGLMNFTVCETCDGPDVLERWKAHNEDLKRRFWWALRREGWTHSG